MKNIPLFTTEFGIASLTLEKIPYSGQAYVVIQSAADAEKLLEECRDFCHAAGAQEIFVSGISLSDEYPLYTQIVTMSRKREGLPATDAVLVPVEKDSLSSWRDIYNEKMRPVPNAAFLSIRDSEKRLQDGNCYYIYKDSQLLGIGVIGENSIEAIAAVVPGGGRDTLLALCGALHTDDVMVEVASNNLPAVNLYHSLGFAMTGVISCWYKIK